MNSMGLKFAASGLSPNFWTSVGFALSIFSALVYASTDIGIVYAAFYGGIILLISGFFDIVDGSVARATKQISHKGAFLDSTFDRFAEVAIFLGILYGGLADGRIVLLALGLSLLVSYTRARAESLGIELKGVGIGERAERLIVIAVFSIASMNFSDSVQYGMIIVAIIAGITFVQRVVSVVFRVKQD